MPQLVFDIYLFFWNHFLFLNPDYTPPTILSFSASSSNAVSGSLATTGDVVTISISASEPLGGAWMLFQGKAMETNSLNDSTFSFQYTVVADDLQGANNVLVDLVDFAGNLAHIQQSSTIAVG
jgi:hypothetical protein